MRRHGAPEIINSDQGCQYTSKEWHEVGEGHGIKISMDGKARCLDNIWIERFWKTIKREYVYLNPEDNVMTCEKAWRVTLIITTIDATIRELITKFRRPDMRPLSRPEKQHISIG